MKRLLVILLALVTVSAVAFAQQNATISGIIETEQPLPDNTRVGIFVVDNENAWRQQVANEASVAGTFDITAQTAPAEEHLQIFRSGAVPLPDFQTEYQVAPEGVRFARALLQVYSDNNGNSTFDRLQDTPYIGIASLENPVGFFVLLYVDQEATLSARGTDLQLVQGWNVFAVSYPEGGDPVYALAQSVDNAVLDVIVP